MHGRFIDGFFDCGEAVVKEIDEKTKKALEDAIGGLQGIKPVNFVTNGGTLNKMLETDEYQPGVIYEVRDGSVFIAVCSIEDCECGLPYVKES